MTFERDDTSLAAQGSIDHPAVNSGELRLANQRFWDVQLVLDMRPEDNQIALEHECQRIRLRVKELCRNDCEFSRWMADRDCWLGELMGGAVWVELIALVHENVAEGWEGVGAQEIDRRRGRRSGGCQCGQGTVETLFLMPAVNGTSFGAADSRIERTQTSRKYIPTNSEYTEQAQINVIEEWSFILPILRCSCPGGTPCI
jgi:hypothetical protein